jgi:hypothetical protein
VSADVKAAITETAVTARALLFDPKGKRKGADSFIALFAMQTVLRIATAAQTLNPQQGHILFDWRAARSSIVPGSPTY